MFFFLSLHLNIWPSTSESRWKVKWTRRPKRSSRCGRRSMGPGGMRSAAPWRPTSWSTQPSPRAAPPAPRPSPSSALLPPPARPRPRPSCRGRALRCRCKRRRRCCRAPQRPPWEPSGLRLRGRRPPRWRQLRQQRLRPQQPSLLRRPCTTTAGDHQLPPRSRSAAASSRAARPRPTSRPPQTVHDQVALVEKAAGRPQAYQA